VTVVDTHHHWIPEKHVKNVEDFVRAGDTIEEVELVDGQNAKRVYRNGVPLITMQGTSRFDVENRIERMDEAGIDKAVTTAATWTSWLDTREICREYNDMLAEHVIDEYPDRFIGAAHVPVGTDYAAAELERCVEDLGFEAVGIATHMHGYPPDHESYHSMYQKAEELDVPVLVHCAAAPVAENAMSEYDMGRTVGRPLDHHVAVGRLLRSDVFEKFPDLNVIHGHLGGTFMMQTFRYGRSADSLESRSMEKDSDALTEAQFEERMQNNYFATTFWDQAGIQFATNTLGPDRMVLGSDYPIRKGIMSDATDAVKSLDIDDGDKEQILEGNVGSLFE
jgi:predicted TIM-barrel fold metal-dependent hydrolase